MRISRYIVAAVLFAVILSGLGADEVPAGGSVTIGRIVTEIDGKTRREPLLRELRIQEGEVYPSLESLNEILKVGKADLDRRRLFREFTISEPVPRGDGIVDIEIRIVDSFTLLPRPMLKYSTDKGLTLGLKMDYFNAFGTLSDHMVQGYWSPQELLFEYNVEKIPVGPAHLGANVQQSDSTTRYGDPAGETQAEYRNTSTQTSVTLELPLGMTSPWMYFFTPIVSWYYNYRFTVSNPEYPDSVFVNDGFAPGLDHGLRTDQVNWEGNLRRGWFFEVINTNLWYTGSRTTDSYLEFDLKGYLPLASWFEISGRIGSFYAFSNPRRNAGDRLRGVVDYMTYGDWGNYLTFQTNFRILETSGGLAIHLRPFVDIGHVFSNYWEEDDGWEYCVGTTFMLYIKSLPSLQLNVDWGWDIKRGMPELIIDTVHFL